MTLTEREMRLIYIAVDYTFHTHPSIFENKDFAALHEKLRLEQTKSMDVEKRNAEMKQALGLENVFTRNEDGTVSYNKEAVVKRLAEMKGLDSRT